MSLSTTAHLIEGARAGRMFILVDDEDRENEGDLVIPAPEVIAYFARYARGLICLALTLCRIEELSLPLIARSNEAPLQTALTVSIEAKAGVTSGISAFDRSRTIAVAINLDAAAPTWQRRATSFHSWQ